MVSGRAAFVISRVVLAKGASFAVLRVPDEGTRVSLGGEGFGILGAQVVDAKLDRLDADFVESE